MKRYTVRAAPGALDWAAASVLTDFAFPWESTTPPSTEFRALSDGQRLHFRYDCVDHDLVLAKGPSAKQRVLGSDRVEIFLASSLKLDPYFCVEMSPSGDVYAYRARSYRQFDDDDGLDGLLVEAHIDGHRYCVQGSLPFATLRALGVLAPEAKELLAGLYRAEFSRNPAGELAGDAALHGVTARDVHFGWMSWVDPRTEQPDFHVPTSFGVLELPG